ncbi:hypothetical protein ACFXHA_45275 [Nocardia sp. NPDC059240]|uniref:hypothetical protein n=1 Tax=Nocardia sp. NPDC059240 TaxID=3346786 RepID=UPI0036839668
MNPEQITALGGGVVAIMTAVFGWLNARQAKRFAELEQRVEHLETELAESKSLFREAVRFIRVLLAHIADLGIAHRTGSDRPPVPEIPERLREEV